MAAEQSRQAIFGETPAPAGNEVVVTGELLADLGPGIAAIKQQNQARASSTVGSARLTRRSLAQFHPLCIRQFNRAHKHNHTPNLAVTVH